MKKYNLFIGIFLFFLIYEPPIFPVNVLHMIGGISWIYILMNRKLVLQVINFHKILNLYFIFTFFVFYVVLVSIANGNSMLAPAPFLYWMVDILPAGIMLTTYFAEKEYRIYDIFHLLLMVGMLQSITAIIAFLVPGIKEIFVNRLILYGYGEVFSRLSTFRIYGFASNLTFSTPIVQSIFTMISVYLAIMINWKYIILTPFLFFSAVINARVSLIIMAIGIIAILLSHKKIKLKIVARIFLIGVVFTIIIKFNLDYIKENAAVTYAWINTGIHEITLFFKGDVSSGYFNYVSDAQRYQLPVGIGLFLGVGSRIMGSNPYNTYSDIGYVNDIWLGGIVYCILMYTTFGLLLLDLLKLEDKKLQINKFLFFFLGGAFVVANIKGYIFSMNNYTTLFFLIYLFLIFYKNKWELKHE